MCKQQIYTAWKKWTEDFSSETQNEILFQSKSKVQHGVQEASVHLIVQITEIKVQ